MKPPLTTVVVSVLCSEAGNSDLSPLPIQIAEYEMPLYEASHRLACATRHERAIARGESEVKNGDVWLRLRGQASSEQVVCFRRDDAADALNFYFAIPITDARKTLSNANVRKFLAKELARLERPT